MSTQIAIVLSGCGFKDGAEIHESVLTLLAVVKAGATPVFFAPDVDQTTVTNHLTGDAAGETRNVLVESARIARGEIKPLSQLSADDADALVLPGGYGAALNLCNFAQKGPDCDVNPDVSAALTSFFEASKPIGAICIAPAVTAKVLGSHQVGLTIGNDAATAEAIGKTGAEHFETSVDGIYVDEKNKIVSTPAYMLAQNIAEAEVGITKLVNKVMELAG